MREAGEQVTSGNRPFVRRSIANGGDSSSCEILSTVGARINTRRTHSARGEVLAAFENLSFRLP